MRVVFLLVALSFATCSYSQSKYSSFTGGVEFGLGASKFIDFNKETNYPNLENKWYLHKLSHISINFGFFAKKYISDTEYLEFGLLYANRSASRLLIYYYSQNGWSISVPTVSLFCVDLPIKYYRDGIRLFNHNMHPYVGIVSSMLFNIQMSKDYYDIPDQYYHKAYFSLCTGLSHQNGNGRLKIQLSSAVTSITKWKYKSEIQALNESYKGVIFPCEVMFVYGYIFN
jgi:hypothetical protein